MRLSGKVINLIGLNFTEQSGQVGAITEITVVELETLMLHVGILIDMINTVGIEQRSSTLNTMNLVPFF